VPMRIVPFLDDLRSFRETVLHIHPALSLPSEQFHGEDSSTIAPEFKVRRSNGR
jgi:hypothetical protein